MIKIWKNLFISAILLIIQGNARAMEEIDCIKGKPPTISLTRTNAVQVYEEQLIINNDARGSYIGDSIDRLLQETGQQDDSEADEDSDEGIIYKLNPSIPWKKGITHPRRNNLADNNHTRASLIKIIPPFYPKEKVENPEEWPWIVNGHLRMQYRSKSKSGEPRTTFLGSGIMISRNCVLTAAHNVWQDGLRPEKISFYIGMKDNAACPINIDGEDIHEFTALGIAINPAYRQVCHLNDKDPKKWASDVALIHLEKNLGEYIGSASIKYKETITDTSFIRISGYPSCLQQDNNIPTKESVIFLNPSQKSLYSMDGEVNSLEVDSLEYIHYNVITAAGQSGSGVCALELVENAPLCFAVHTYGPHESGNVGTLITKNKFDMIKKWIDYFENNKLFSDTIN